MKQQQERRQSAEEDEDFGRRSPLSIGPGGGTGFGINRSIFHDSYLLFVVKSGISCKGKGRGVSCVTIRTNGPAPERQLARLRQEATPWIALGCLLVIFRDLAKQMLVEELNRVKLFVVES